MTAPNTHSIVTTKRLEERSPSVRRFIRSTINRLTIDEGSSALSRVQWNTQKYFREVEPLSHSTSSNVAAGKTAIR